MAERNEAWSRSGLRRELRALGRELEQLAGSPEERRERDWRTERKTTDRSEFLEEINRLTQFIKDVRDELHERHERQAIREGEKSAESLRRLLERLRHDIERLSDERRRRRECGVCES